MLDKLEEKASIDWNNYLTKQEIKNFLNKDDKIESAENIIYDTKGNFFNKYWNNFKEQGWTKNDLVKDLEQFYVNGHLITEGIHLIAYVKDKKSGEYSTIEDRDYNSKKDFERELRANGYSNISILDNRDMYLIDNTDYTRVSQLKKELDNLKKDIKTYDKEKYPFLYKDTLNKYNKLKEVYDNVMKISLTEGYVLKGIQDGKSFNISFNDNKEKLQKFKDELQKSHKDIGMYIIEESFNYLDDADKPKYNDYIGLSMQIDGTKTKIKTLKAKINKDKYDVDKNKHKYQLNYYEQLLNKYEDVMNNIKGLKEGTTIKAKYKPMVKDFYKTPTGTWMIDLNDGYVTSYGTNYIEAKTKTQCIYELENFVTPYDYIHSDKDTLNENLSENSDSITLYHNTTNENAVKINKEGIKTGTRLSVYGKGSEAEGAGIWCTTKRGFGYGGATITFQVNKNEKELRQQNDTEYILYRDVTPKEIIDIDLVISNIPCVKHFDKSSNTTVESDIPNGIKKWGKDKLLKVFKNNTQSFVEPYNYEQLLKLIETGNKYCKGKITLNESNCLNNEFKNKLEEVSRNELLVKTKGETITRYNKAAGYKGFSIINIDTSDLLRGNTLTVTCRVGKYNDVLQLEDVLYWIQIVAENKQNGQINTKGITEALSNSIDGMDIKIDCNCGDFIYRFAYQATEWGYKYGKPETRPADIRNPDGYGALCKHLTAMLSNKKWLQQVTSTVMDWCVKNIDSINKFLKLTNEDKKLTLPNELARQNAKKAFYTKLFNKDDDNEEGQEDTGNNLEDIDKDNSNNNENSNNNNNTVDNQNAVEDETQLQDVDTEEDKEN